MMLAQAENEEEVRKILENDIYVRSGVWDMEKAQIIPVSATSASLVSSLSPFIWLMGIWGLVQVCRSSAAVGYAGWSMSASAVDLHLWRGRDLAYLRL
jgi:hypothetical protein